jgi:hypothetical protein
MDSTYRYVEEQLKQANYTLRDPDQVTVKGGYHFRTWGLKINEVRGKYDISPIKLIDVAKANKTTAVVMPHKGDGAPLLIAQCSDWDKVKKNLLHSPEEPAGGGMAQQVMIMLDGTGDPHPGVPAPVRIPVLGGMPKPGPVIVKIEDEVNDVVPVEPRGRKRRRAEAVDDDVVIVEPPESRRKRNRQADPPEDDAEDVIYVKTYPARR